MSDPVLKESRVDPDVIVRTVVASGPMFTDRIEEMREEIQTLLDKFREADAAQRTPILKEIDLLVRDMMHLFISRDGHR